MSLGGSDEKPIYSSRLDDLEFRDAIDEFVVGVAERIDQLQDAQAKQDLKLLAELARALIIDSAKLGFESLARCAEVVRAASLAHDSQKAHRHLVELTRISRRIRLGHRGAV